MPEFNNDRLEHFLGVVRKYMQVRGPMNQKELAVLTEVGVSTMSRFLNQKTSELNPQLIAKIVAKLEIPLHEIIDFVEEDYADKFIRLVKFYKNEGEGVPPGTSTDISYGRRKDDYAGSEGTASRSTTANMNVGGKKASIPFESSGTTSPQELSFKEKFERLTPRQKAYLTDFLNLDMDGRDLIVDLGTSLMRYFRVKGMEF